MTDSGTPIQSQSARLFTGGPRKKHGVILLYPDELTIVAISTDTWAYILGPGAWICLLLPTFHTIGWLAVFLGFLAGIGGGEQVNRWRAARKAVAGGDGVTRVPLDLITGHPDREVPRARRLVEYPRPGRDDSGRYGL